jgi:hypothetical protein
MLRLKRVNNTFPTANFSKDVLLRLYVPAFHFNQFLFKATVLFQQFLMLRLEFDHGRLSTKDGRLRFYDFIRNGGVNFHLEHERAELARSLESGNSSSEFSDHSVFSLSSHRAKPPNEVSLCFERCRPEDHFQHCSCEHHRNQCDKTREIPTPCESCP